MKGTLRLTVKATSSAQPNAALTVLGYGSVTYNAKKKEDTFQGTLDSVPATVTVQSSKGGLATMAVRERSRRMAGKNPPLSLDRQA